MGSPKAALDWHGSTLLRRVTGLAQRTVEGPVVVVRAAGQQLPELQPSVEIVDDAREGRGPLQGLAAGFAAVGERAEVAYVSSTDVPLLHPAFIRRVLGGFGQAVDVVLPEVHGFRQPLSAGYRDQSAAERRGADRGRQAQARVSVRAVSGAPTRQRGDASGPSGGRGAILRLLSVSNLNERSDYEQALARAAPEIAVRRSGLWRQPARGGIMTVRGVDAGRRCRRASICSSTSTSWLP